jgi:hypothetical protein
MLKDAEMEAKFIVGEFIRRKIEIILKTMF